jgi:hypothetical protein
MQRVIDGGKSSSSSSHKQWAKSIVGVLSQQEIKNKQPLTWIWRSISRQVRERESASAICLIAARPD